MDAPAAPDARFANWQPGDRLTLRGENWSVEGCTPYPDCEALRVNSDRHGGRQTFLLPFDRPRAASRDRIAIVSLRAWFHRFKGFLANTYPYGGFRYCPHTIDLLAYQFEPAVAMLRDGHPRLLVADEVGLGKTIEAGLILRELAMRQDGFRAVLLVPAGLRQQWSDELSRRFGLEAILADASWLRGAERALPLDVNPWSLPGVYLSSFDFVKRPEALRPLEDVRWDLLVVDEAHAATLLTDRRAAIDAIAVRAHRVLLLTATPPGDASDFAGLCRIGAFAGEPDLPIFQRARSDQVPKKRRRSIIPVRLSDAERNVHRALGRYTGLMWAEAGRSGNPHARLVSTLLRKRALSSAAALELSLRRRKELLGSDAAALQHQLLLPLRDEDCQDDDVVPDASLSAAVLGDATVEDHWLEHSIAAAAVAAADESKARVLKRLLSRLREPVIVFTEYRDSLAFLQGQLHAEGIRTCALHGGLSPADRRAVLAEFVRGEATLLATDAAAEGLNLQERCRTVVHYELPWNPARMLQRAGRVDRIGQSRAVHEIALVASDTAESLVIAPLARRVAGWCHEGGRALLEWLTESRIAEAVFEGRVPEPNKPQLQPARVPVDVHLDAVRESRRLEAHRLLVKAGTLPSPRTGDLPCAVLERSSLRPGMVLLYELQVLNGRDPVERTLAGFHCTIALPPWPRKRSLLRSQLADVLRHVLPVASPKAVGLAQKRAVEVAAGVKKAAERARARARSLDHASESAARQIVQIGLFDHKRTPNTSTLRRSTELFQSIGSHSTDPSAAPGVSWSADLRALLVIAPP